MYLSLVRDTATPGYSLGVLTAGALAFQSIERPWIDAPPGLGGHLQTSCVPAGVYELVLHNSPKHAKAFALVNPHLDVFHQPGDVPPDRRSYARTDVLLHPGNFAAELLGCVALGLRRGTDCVLQSVDAFERFNLTVPWIPGHSLGISYAAGVTS
ncbi:MAG: hypothetical protein JWO52_4028 [Gammaproteobacteria bacterium]|nr:hypothetical protein [Gammaproteobacteria bacterium]